jgi:hypothetical protein
MLIFAVALGCAGSDRAASSQAPTRLFLAGDGELTVVDVESARAEVHPLAILAPGDPAYRIVRRGRALAVWGGDEPRVTPGDTYRVGLALESPPRKVAQSFWFIPSVAPDRVWVVVRNPYSATSGSPPVIREVNIGGEVTFLDVAAPNQYGPRAAVGAALVFEDGRGGLELWNPTTGNVVRRLPDATLGPTHGNKLGWCAPDRRALHILNVRSGRETVTTPPAGVTAFDCASGAFSTNGATLAIATTVRGYDSNRRLALIDADGRATIVKGSDVGPEYSFVTWSSAGDSVFVTGARGNDRQIVRYRVGGARAIAVPVEVGPFFGIAAS